MDTFVRKEILDKSILGDKIFGGDINYVEKLYTDELWVPSGSTPSSGAGSINGASFKIGLIEPIEVIFAENIGAIGDNTSISLYSSSIQPRAYMATSSGRGYIDIWSATEQTHRFSSFANSYIKNKLIIGGNSAAYPSAICEVLGGLYVSTGIISNGDINIGTNSFRGKVVFPDGFGAPQTLTDFFDDYILNIYDLRDINAAFYDGSILPQTVASLVTIDTTSIDGAAWSIVASLSTRPTIPDVDVTGEIDVGDGVAFGGTQVVGSRLNNYKLVETVGDATCDFDTLSDSIDIDYEIVGKTAIVKLGATLLTASGSDAGPSYLLIDLSHANFDDLWDFLGSGFTTARYMGPYVRIGDNSGAATYTWKHSILTVWLSGAPYAKKIVIGETPSVASPLAVGTEFPDGSGGAQLPDGDSIGFSDFRFIIS